MYLFRNLCLLIDIFFRFNDAYHTDYRTMVNGLDEYKAFYKLDKQLNNNSIYDLSIVRYHDIYCVHN